jgi:hypothetical protein
VVRELRERLWSEHVGDHGIALKLAGWKSIASRNVVALNGDAEAGHPALSGSFVLPYSPSGRPRAQLADLGILASAPIDLEFDPGWLEVNFSPNWVRNMFL